MFVFFPGHGMGGSRTSPQQPEGLAKVGSMHINPLCQKLKGPVSL